MVLLLATAGTAFVVKAQTNVVTIREGNDVQTCYTMENDAQEILEDNGIALSAYDAINFTGISGKVGEIRIVRAFPVLLQCDGENARIMVTGGTVRDVIEQADITLGKYDLVNMPLAKVAEEGDQIMITRQSFVTREDEVTLDYDTVKIPTCQLMPGAEEILIAGETGLRVDSYSQMFVNGTPREEFLLSSETVKKPVPRQLLVGFASQPVSPLDFNLPFDDDGAPIGYLTVLHGQKAAGYSAKPGAGTASGRKAMVGHVAVNPNVIPYGSRLFIQTPDKKFVYGYAVAADTGTALTQGIIDVDLFYASYEESARNGIQWVDIYVLPPA